MKSKFAAVATYLAGCVISLAIGFALVYAGMNHLLAQGPGAKAVDPLDELLPSAAPAKSAAAPPAAVPPAGSAAQDTPKSPLVRSVLKMLDELGGDEATDEQRKLVREEWLKADAELDRSLGDNSRQKILLANQRLSTGRIRIHDDGSAPQLRPRLAPGARGRMGLGGGVKVTNGPQK